MRSVFFAAATAAFAAASTAAPQSDYTPKEIRHIAYEYGRCVVGNHAAAASKALLSDVDNETLVKRYPELISGDCLVRSTQDSAEMEFPGDLYSYALADALVAREFAASPVPDLSKAPPLQRRALPNPPTPPPADAGKSQKARYEHLAAAFEKAQAFRGLDEYGECVVRTNPAAAKGLLLTQPDTPAENSSFTALQAALSQCLQEGTVAFGRTVLRGTIAVNYYRLAHAAHADAPKAP